MVEKRKELPKRKEPAKPGEIQKPDAPRIQEKVRPLDVDEFGSVVPFRAEPSAVAVALNVDEFGHVGLTSRVEFTPEKRKREVGKLTQLFKKQRWQGDTKYFERLIDNGWTAGRITGENQLLATHEWYGRQLGTTVELRLGEVGGYKPGGVSYDTQAKKWVLRMDLSKPQFEFRRFEKYEDMYFLHEHTHEIQGRLMGLDTVGMLNKTYPVGEKKEYLANLGFRDWERDFSMPPVFFTDEQRRRLAVVRDDKEIARHARDIHADATALRTGYQHVKLNDREQALGLTPLTKTLLEHIFETLNYTPQNLGGVYGDQFDARENIPLLARFRAVGYGILKKTEDLNPEDRKAMADCLDLVAARIRQTDMKGYTVVDLKGDTIKDKIKSMNQAFDWHAKHHFNPQQQEAYNTLVDTYSKHLLYCIDRKKALTEVGPQALTEALNDEKNPLVRARAADYLGGLGDLKALDSLTKRLRKEVYEFTRWNILNTIVELSERNLNNDASWSAIDLAANEGGYRLRGRITEAIANAPEEKIRNAVSTLTVLSTIIYPPQFGPSWRYPEGRHVKDKVCSALAKIGKKHPYSVVDLLRKLKPEYHDEYPQEIERSMSPERGPASALAEIGKTRVEEVVDICGRLISTGDYDDTQLAVGTLSQVGKNKPSEALGLLKKVYETHPQGRGKMGEASFAMQRHEVINAVGIIGAVKPDEALAFLGSLQIQKGQVEEFSGALERIGEQRPEEAAVILQEVIGKSGSIVGANTIARMIKIGAIKCDDAVRLLEKYSTEFGETDDHGAQPYMIIGATGSDLALDVLSKLSRSEKPGIRAVVVAGLIKMGLKKLDEALDAIEKMLEDPNVEVRKRIAYGLGVFGRQRPQRVCSLLHKLKDDPNEYVVLAMGNSLESIAADYPDDVFDMSKHIIRRAGRSRQGGIRFTPDGEEEVYSISYLATAIGAVASHNPDEAFDLLQDMLVGGTKGMNKAIDALGEVGKYRPDKTLGILKGVITRRDKFNRIHATHALTKFATPSEINQIILEPTTPQDVRHMLREHLIKTNQNKT